jgi:hypothetical protein
LVSPQAYCSLKRQVEPENAVAVLVKKRYTFLTAHQRWVNTIRYQSQNHFT